jgi:hypothetical protein
MFVLRLRSFNALEEDLRRPRRWEGWVGQHKPSADTLGYALQRFDLEPLRQILQDINRAAWRKKAIHFRSAETRRVVAIDGHEFFSSRARCCDQCLIREVTVHGEVLKEYYHRGVAAQWVGVKPPGFLDWEITRPGEGEAVTARRLLARILAQYGRLIDVISADALYLEAPFLKLVLDAGKHFVVVLKQEARELYRDAAQLRELLAPQVILDGCRTTQIWDIPDLATFTTLGRPVRVVWCHERDVKTKIVGNKKQDLAEEKTWIWVTDLPISAATSTRIQLWGHDRWDVEDRGFNELGNLWRMNHCFVHDTTAIEALLLTLAIAFLTTYLFYERNLQPVLRIHLTRLALAFRMAEDLTRFCGVRLWPKTLDSS